jgi:hypothetical protein
VSSSRKTSPRNSRFLSRPKIKSKRQNLSEAVETNHHTAVRKIQFGPGQSNNAVLSSGGGMSLNCVEGSNGNKMILHSEQQTTSSRLSILQFQYIFTFCGWKESSCLHRLAQPSGRIVTGTGSVHSQAFLPCRWSVVLTCVTEALWSAQCDHMPH